MPFTYDPTTDRGKVRLLGRDRKGPEADALYTDAEIDSYLDMSGQNVFLAAAMVLENTAADQVLLLKHIKLLDISTNGPAVSEELRELAKRLRLQADASDVDDPGFDIVEFVR